MNTKEQSKEQQHPQPIPIGYNAWKEQAATIRLNKVCTIADERVIPAMRKLVELGELNGLVAIRQLAEPLTVEAILHYLADSDNLKADYMQRTLEESGVESLNNAYLVQSVKNKAEQEFNDLFDRHGLSPWDDTKCPKELQKYLTIGGQPEELRFDAERIREDVTIYLQDEARPVYEKMQQLAEGITELFKGAEIPPTYSGNPFDYFKWNELTEEAKVCNKPPYLALAKAMAKNTNKTKKESKK